MVKIYLFYTLAVMLVLLAGMVATLRNLFHAALALGAAFACTAVLFLMLGAEFLAAVQVLIYVGAVTILIVFGIFLTQRLGDRTLQHVNRGLKRPAAAVMAVLLALLIPVLLRTEWRAPGSLFQDVIPRLGYLLLNEFLLPFEVVSVLFLAALVGGITIARRSRP